MLTPNKSIKGFYCHYKHDPSGDFNNYTYEVVGLGRNTEEKADTEYTVLYRPLYKNDWMEPATYQSRPYDIFTEDVEVNGNMIPRFQLITDKEIIEKLEKVKQELYS